MSKRRKRPAAELDWPAVIAPDGPPPLAPAVAPAPANAVDATPPAAPPNELEIRDPDTLFVYKNFLTLGGVFGAGYSLDVFQKPEDASDWRCYRRDHTLDDNSVIVGVSEPVLWASGAEGVAPNGYAYLASEALRIAAVHYPTVPPPPTAAAVRKTRKRRDKAERAEAEKAAADRAG